MKPAHPASAIPLDRLLSMTMDEQRALWSERWGRPPPLQRRILVRELAWRVQEQAHGGLDAETRRLLNIAMRKAIAERPMGSAAGEQPKTDAPALARQSHGKASTVRAAPRGLPSSTRLVRTWRGTLHEVYVLNGGCEFRYRDKVYRSLSELAREITGTRWSGPRFFGLTTREHEGDKGDDSSATAQLRRAGGKRS